MAWRRMARTMMKRVGERMKAKGKAGKQIACALCVSCCVSLMACWNLVSLLIRHLLLRGELQDGIYGPE